MSGIYIPGMEMPKSCHKCPLVDTLMTCPCMKMPDKDFWDSVLLEFARHEDCPLVPVPDHGELIDRDAFERRCMFDSNIEDMQDVIYALRDYPTIIPADGKDGAE